MKSYIPIALSYGAVVGALYLFSYWGSFNINVLEFIGLSDLLKLALYPLLVSIASLLAGYVIGVLMSGDMLPPGSGANTAIGRVLNLNRPLLALANLSAILAAFVLLEAPHKWFVVALLTSIFSVAFTRLPFFVELIPNARARQSILYLAIFVAGLAFYHGSSRAHYAKLGQSPLVVDVARSNLKLQTSVGRPVIYLGYLGGYFALLETSSGTVVLVKPKDDSAFFLVSNVKGGS